MRKKSGFLLVEGETFPYDVVVCLGVTKQNILDYMQRKFKNALLPSDIESLGDGTVRGRTVQLDNKAFLIWLPKYPTDPQGISDLVHEIFHTADLMLRGLGAKLSNDSDEIWAYHIGWLTKRIFTAFKL